MEQLDINGIRVLFAGQQGHLLATGQDALDLIGDTWGTEADMVAVPVGRLHPDFFVLRTGIAGEFIQKFQNYNLRLAVVGDIAAAVDASKALHDFVYETNCIGHHCFAPSRDALIAALSA